MTSAPWWERLPERLERELEALGAAGFSVTRDEAAFAAGILRLTLHVDGPAGVVELVATYPDEFPYFKPLVTAAALGLAHHWNPVTGEVCLLPTTGDRRWRPASDTLAVLLCEQWPEVLASQNNDGVSSGGELLEQDQAEPVTVYLQPQPETQLIVGTTLDPGDGIGTAHVALTQTSPLRGHVTRLDAPSGEVLWTTDPVCLDEPPVIAAAWVRLDEMPNDLSAGGVLSAVLAAHPELAKSHWVPTGPGRRPGRPSGHYGSQVQVILVVVPEEVARRSVGLGWLAVTRTREVPGKTSRPQLARITRAGRDDLFERAPQLRTLGERSVMIVGGGGLGAAVAMEIGRVPLGDLVLVDGDFVDAATAVRFPAAFRLAGTLKVTALARLVNESQPYTQIRHLAGRVGTPRLDNAPSDQHAILLEELRQVDLVVDATADVGVQHYLSDQARRLGVAYLQAEATRGVRGGLIALYRPGQDCCWVCVQHHLRAGTIPPLPEDVDGSPQPPGCPEPTYTGAGFDLAALASMTVRVAAACLTGAAGYGTFAEDVFTVRLHDGDRPIPPDWQGHHLDRHPACDNHPR